MTTFFANIIGFLVDLGKYLLEGITYLLQFIIYTLVDGLLTVVTGFFNSLNLANYLGSYIADWSGLPSQMGYVIGQTGIPACITLLLGAVTIRVLLNLIPSWATRV